MRLLAAVTLSLLAACASKPPPVAPAPEGPSPEMRAFLEQNRVKDDPNARAARETVLQNAEATSASNAHAMASLGDASSTLKDIDRRSQASRRAEYVAARAEYDRKRTWVSANCQRRRLDVTTADTSRILVGNDGVRYDTFTQASTYFVCPADAPAEMQAFAKTNPDPPTPP